MGGAGVYDVRTGSTWKSWLSTTRGTNVEARGFFGCSGFNRGTFHFTPFANQDPLFYAHHSFTFVSWEIAMQRLHKSPSENGGPYFNFEQMTANEMSGAGL